MKIGESSRVATLALLVLGLSLGGCSQGPRKIRAPEMLARVMDAETGDPVVGATAEVRVHIERPTSNIEHMDSRVIYSYQTTVGADGRFTLPAWGPIDIPDGWHLFEDDPEIVLKKEGYGFTTFGNDEWKHHPKKDAAGATILEALWDHQTLLFEKERFYDEKNFGRNMYPLDDPLDRLPGRSRTH